MNTIFLIDLLTAIWLGFVGACIGSFLNVVAYRMPLGMSIVWKPSHCPKCSHPIRPYDNVPVLGWLWLRGRCRDCREPISPRYAIVELVMGVAFFVLAYVELFSGGANLPGGPLTDFTGAADVVWNPQWQVVGIYVYHGALLSLLMSLLLIDQDQQVVPGRFTAFSLAVAIAAPVYYLPPSAVLKDVALGVATGWLAGWLITKIAQRASLLRRNRANTLVVALTLVGASLGWQAALIVAALSSVFWILGGATALSMIWIATLALILFRGAIATSMPW